MLAIIEYGAGNQTSVKRALEFLGIPCQITANPEDILSASSVIFPGVGAAAQAMSALKKNNLDKVMRQTVEKKIPLLGICLGCQILLDGSDEENTPTLGIVHGRCLKFNPDWLDETNRKIRIPHMGWNGIKKVRKSILWNNIPDEAEFYFVHGYYAEPPEELILATTAYGHEFCSVYGKPGLWAAQFHPEKSGKPGLQFLANFYEYSQKQKGTA